MKCIRTRGDANWVSKTEWKSLDHLELRKDKKMRYLKKTEENIKEASYD